MSKLFASLNTQRLLVAILFVMLFALAVRVPVDTDTWWHLRSGEYTLQTRAVPQVDPFSITRGGQEWINQSWLSQLVMVFFYRVLGGNIGLAIYTALLATAGMAFVFRISPGNVYTRAFIAILSAATAAVFWSARPQMMSFFLSTVTLFLLDRYKRHKIDQLWLFIPLMILWVNLHSGFAIGFIFMLAFIGGEIANRLFNRSAPEILEWRQIGKLILIAMLSGAALIINPYTIQMLTYPFRTAGIGSLQAYIQEWASPDFKGRETWPFLALLFGTFAAAGFSKRGLDWTDLALVCGTAFLALLWQRNFAVFAHVQYILENNRITLAKPRPVRGAAIILNWSFLLLVIVGALLKCYVALNPKTVSEAQAEFLPVKVANYLNTAKPAQPMFNTYNWGGYLLFAAPDYKVFVDGRTDLYDDQILNKWRLAMLGENWQQVFSEYDIKLVVIEKDSTLAKILAAQPGWKLGYSDEKVVVYEKIV
jgi:hypothetical protein